MKKITVCLLLIFTMCIQNMGVALAAADPRKVYSYKESFNGNGDGGFWLQYKINNEYKVLSKYSNELSEYYIDTEQTGKVSISNNALMPSNKADAIIKWVVPRSGTVVLYPQKNIVVDSANGDGVTLRIINKGVEIWSTPLLAGDANGVTYSEELVVEEGDAIYFEVNCYEYDDYDKVLWNPCIKYQDASIADKSSFADVDEKYQEMVKKLIGLGIMDAADSTNFGAGNNVTRAEFVSIVMRTMGFEDAPYDSICGFSDVSTDYWAYGSIINALNLNLIGGYSDGTFGPEDNITYESAIVILVRALGLNVYANSQAGYPFGYFSIASNNKLKPDKKLNYTDYLTKLDTAQLINAALEIDIVEQVKFGEEVTYETKKNNNLLKKYLDIEKRTGMVTGYLYKSIFGNNINLKNDEIIIDDEKFNVKNTDLQKYFGKIITYYVKIDEDRDVSTIVYGYPKYSDNSFEVNAEDITAATNDKQFVYWDEDNQQKVNLSPVADLYLNGSLVTYNLENLIPKAGTVTLIDSDNDGEYDKIFVKNIKTKVVGDVDNERKIIYLSSDELINLENYKGYRIEKDGGEIQVAGINKDDVLSIEENSDFIGIDVCSDKIEGELTEKGADYLRIDDKKYEILNNDDLMADILKLKVGNNYTMLLNSKGEIAAVKINTDTGKKYAWLYKVGKNSSLKNLEIKLFTQQGEFKIFTLKSKSFLDDKEKSNAEFMASSSIFNGENLIQQLIIYEDNGLGEITKIYTAPTSFTKGVENQKMSFRASSFINQSDGTANASITYKTPIFCVPDGADATEDDFSIKTISNIQDTDDLKYWIWSYDIDKEMKYAHAIVMKSDVSGTNDTVNEHLLLVEKVVSIIDDLNEVSKIFGYYNGSFVTYITSKEGLCNNLNFGGTLKNLDYGDIVRIATNGRGRVTKIEPIASASNLKYSGIPMNWADNAERGVYGKVYRIDSDLKKLLVDLIGPKNQSESEYISSGKLLENSQVFPMPTPQSIFICDKEKKKIYKGTVNDIVVNDVVVFYVRYVFTQHVFILKGFDING